MGRRKRSRGKSLTATQNLMEKRPEDRGRITGAARARRTISQTSKKSVQPIASDVRREVKRYPLTTGGKEKTTVELNLLPNESGGAISKGEEIVRGRHLVT